MRGDKDCVDKLASSVYDTKPVHYLSMVCEQIEWVVKEKVSGFVVFFVFQLILTVFDLFSRKFIILIHIQWRH